MKYYIYKTTNLTNNKIYIGYHYSNDIDNDKYLGSGYSLLKSIKKYGKKYFKREILFEFDNSDDAFNKEKEIVNEDFVKRRDTYNTTIGGKGWCVTHDAHNKGKITIYSPKTDKNYYINENELQKFLDDGYILGNKLKNNRNCVKKDDNIKYVDNETLKTYLNNGWKKSNTTENKICVTHVETKKLKYVTPSDLNSFLENGYIKGNYKSGVNKGKLFISKDGINKRINQDELTKHIDLGWEQKRVQKRVKIKRMYNPETNELKNINVNDVKSYLNNGWKIGINYVTFGVQFILTKTVNIKEFPPLILISTQTMGGTLV